MTYQEELENKIEQIEKTLEETQIINDKLCRFVDRLNEFIQDRLPVYKENYIKSLRTEIIDEPSGVAFNLLKVIQDEITSLNK